MALNRPGDVSRVGGYLRAWISTWPLWRLPLTAVLAILVVDTLACALAIGASVGSRPNAGDLGRLLLIILAAGIYGEISSRTERMRRYLAPGAMIGMASVWTFSAAILLPLSYTAVVVCAFFGLSAIRGRQSRTVKPHRVFLTGSAVFLSAAAASVAAHAIEPNVSRLPGGSLVVVAVVAAMVIYCLANNVLVISVMRLAVGNAARWRQLVPSRDELCFELATLVLAVLTAQTLLRMPLLLPAVLLLMALLQRSSLVSQLEVAATTDAKTGLLNATAWQELAKRQLMRAERDESPCSLLLLDLDYFKRVNDTHGHLVGDQALKAVADALRRELRGYDAIARFGGEEFVMLLNDLDPNSSRSVCERILDRIRGLPFTGTDEAGEPCSITASIGLAFYPEHGRDLTDLLEAADGALYGAKSAGRDRVGEPHFPHSVQRGA